jgi:aspartate/methionine/tyrosine aminotransferase
LKPRLASQSVIDAVKLALEDENAHQYQSYQGLPELRKVWLILFE